MLWLSKCVATLSWPTALDAAAQKQISHVIRGGPLQRQGGKQKGWGVCMVEWRQGAIFGSSLLISGLINTRNPPPSYRQAAQCIPAQLCEFSVKGFGGAGVKCFCERLWNTRLRVWTAPSAFLPHPETTSIWWHCTGGKKTNKKNLIGSVKINKVTPTKKKKKKKHGTVFPYRPLHRNTHSSNETSSASLHPYARASHHHHHHHHLLLCVNISNEEPISGQQPLQHWWYLSLWYDKLIADQFSQSKAAFLPLSPKIIALLRLHQYSVFVYWPPFISAGSFFLKV